MLIYWSTWSNSQIHMSYVYKSIMKLIVSIDYVSFFNCNPAWTLKAPLKFTYPTLWTWMSTEKCRVVFSLIITIDSYRMKHWKRFKRYNCNWKFKIPLQHNLRLILITNKCVRLFKSVCVLESVYVCECVKMKSFSFQLGLAHLQWKERDDKRQPNLFDPKTMTMAITLATQLL